MLNYSRTPQGVRGLKLLGFINKNRGFPSHSARSAWIETLKGGKLLREKQSRTPQGVRGLKQSKDVNGCPVMQSHSARSAWIETSKGGKLLREKKVALRKECVD
mgnify:CR=1 FL=1